MIREGTVKPGGLIVYSDGTEKAEIKLANGGGDECSCEVVDVGPFVLGRCVFRID